MWREKYPLGLLGVPLGHGKFLFGDKRTEIERKKGKKEKWGGESEEMGIEKNCPFRFGNTRCGKNNAFLGKVWGRDAH